MSGGNYFIAVEHILSSLQWQRLKLFDRLSITTTHYHDPSLCCSQELTEEELLIVDDAVMTTDDLLDSEAAALYYSCGYIAFKEGMLHINDVDTSLVSESDFLNQVTRGGLTSPSPALFAFGRSCYYIFSTLCNSDKGGCCSRFVRLFECLGSSFPCDFSGKLCSISRHLTFFLKVSSVPATNREMKLVQVQKTQTNVNCVN